MGMWVSVCCRMSFDVLSDACGSTNGWAVVILELSFLFDCYIVSEPSMCVSTRCTLATALSHTTSQSICAETDQQVRDVHVWE